MILLIAVLALFGGAFLFALVVYGMTGDDWVDWLTEWPSGMPVSLAGIIACMVSGPMIFLAMIIPAWEAVGIIAGAWLLAIAVAIASRFYHLFIELRHMRSVRRMLRDGKKRKKKGPAV